METTSNVILQNFKIIAGFLLIRSVTETMDRYLKLFVGFVFIFLLAGCIGEDYDFSPPTVNVYNPNDIDSQQTLAEANIDWKHEDQIYNKETEDIKALAEEQNIISFKAGDTVSINLEDGDFVQDRISVSLLKNEDNIELEYNGKQQTFNLPMEKGEFILVVGVDTSRGNAQYVGNLVIQ